MTKEKAESIHLKAARDILASASASPLTLEEREGKAIELTSHLILEADKSLTREERKEENELSKMMQDPIGKIFTIAMMDQCFRSRQFPRIADQLNYLLNLLGIPPFFSPIKRLVLYIFKQFGLKFPNFLIPYAAHFFRKNITKGILFRDTSILTKYSKKRRQEGIRLNFNHVGEAILGKEEANKRFQTYLHDLHQPFIDYLSVKLSSFCATFHPLYHKDLFHFLAEKLRLLFREAMKYKTILPDGTETDKFVNLDVEDYRDLLIAKNLFKAVLSEEEFLSFSAGIALPAYFPESYDVLIELTEWGIERNKSGGAPIKIRLVKGNNLALEQLEASLQGWPQAPYQTKVETDANFKKMLLYACHPEHAQAIHFGIASHNLFDISFALLLRAENHLEHSLSFEMLEGEAKHIRRTLQKLVSEMILYTTLVTKEEFQSAIPYLFRRLHEHIGPENFLGYSFRLKPESKEWDFQVSLFSESCKQIKTISNKSRREQNRLEPPMALDPQSPFENEPNTDFSLSANRTWIEKCLSLWTGKKIDHIPLIIGGKDISYPHPKEIGYDPTFPDRPLYTYSVASAEEIEIALKTAKQTEKAWATTPFDKRYDLFIQAAQKLRENRGHLICTMIADTAKTVLDADIEISKTIDFAEYYARSMLQLSSSRDLEWSPKGTISVITSWGDPLATPAGALFAALITGNTVLFKSAPESVLTSFELVKILWEAGIPKEVLQFINCEDAVTSSKLVQDQRINTVMLAGQTATAQHFLSSRPGLDLLAETGAKNGMIISAISDHDLAIQNLLQSAFEFNGQKNNVVSLAILEKEIYEDVGFRKKLKNAAASLKIGPAWDISNNITPLLRAPSPSLLRGLTTLEPGEFWLLKPTQDKDNPHLWSPGIKYGVQKGNYTHQTEFFGPLLGIMCAENLDHAIHLANSTPYGLMAGLYTLDKREQKKWQKLVIAGNCYINRTTTGSMVHRQPFGGCKKSYFGPGAKMGGPNYLVHLMHAKQIAIPKEKLPVGEWVNNLTRFLEKFDLSAEELGIWYASISSYAFFWHQFKRDKDRTKVVGQDNFFRHSPLRKMAFRIGPEDSPLDYLRVFAAALTCETRLEVSWEKGEDIKIRQADWETMLPIFNIIEESEEDFIQRIKTGHISRIRLLHPPSDSLKQTCAELFTYIDNAPVLANGRIELLNYLRGIVFSIDYHRYGNLGLREGELRHPIL